MNPGRLYLLPNTLGDVAIHDTMPLPVAQIAARLTYLVGENAKSTRAYLKRVAAVTPLAKPIQEIMISELDVNTPDQLLANLLAPILAGQDGGIVSEAGVPAVADPGARLVALAHAHDVEVIPLVGPSSLLLALMASGLNGQRFTFYGYVPTDAATRASTLKKLEERSRKEKETQILIETPYRNGALFDALINILQARTRLCVATDLTLPSQQIRTLAISQWKKQRPAFDKKPTVFLFLAD